MHIYNRPICRCRQLYRQRASPLTTGLGIIASLALLIEPTLSLEKDEVLRCSVCRGDYYVGLHANDLQKLRLATNMPYPDCAYYEAIDCDRDHDVCVKVTMEMGIHNWWLQMGCGARDQYPTVNVNECVSSFETQAETYYDANYGNAKRTRTRRITQTTCICDRHHCNGAMTSHSHYRWSLLTILFLLLAILSSR